MIRAWPLMVLYRRPWPISSAVAPRLDPSIPVEEEKTPNYHADRFYPIHLGQVLAERYQIATKLGYGANSTVWLARDLNRWRWSQEKYVAIKVNTTSRRSRRPKENELDIMRHISQVNPQHKGWNFVRKLFDSFALQGASGTHSCLVLEALREPLWLYQTRYIGGVIPPDILKILVQMILRALDYLHSECRIVHTDLKPDNIMVKIEDPSIFERDAQDEFDNPLLQKHVNEHHIIYLSRNNYGPLSVPTGIIQIVDFDLSVRAEPGKIHMGAIQGEIYRAPEVILNAGYTYSADIWSLGVTLWDLLEGKSLFNPTAPGKADEYDDQSHLGQISALIGPPPQSLLSSGQRTSIFYKPNGELKDPGRVPAPGDFTFEKTISCMSGEEKLRFIRFIKRMVRWSPEGRSTARELLDDPWLYEDFPQD
ncbi:hypothetical protein FGADI_9131 [Fusarium gaditjirri]|uniref:non-specific serine/threonine protein kinase n=1 Tax=Fusarium gaditjirri TaxID=282569 RepID=A0A8H4WSY3_9HYPO|nr:hypothetical protein FGADI_9131 [Fusarium gaditjirri]